MSIDERIISKTVITGPEAKGIASLVKYKDGRVVLRIQDYYIAEGAPDARFYLTPDADGSVDVSGVVDFGKLEQLHGTVEFDLPNAAKASWFKVVVVYCRQYSRQFGKGKLL